MKAPALAAVEALGLGAERAQLGLFIGAPAFPASALAKALAVLRAPSAGAGSAALEGRVLIAAGRWDEAARVLESSMDPRALAWRAELAVLRAEPDAGGRLDRAAAAKDAFPWAFAFRAAWRCRRGEWDAAQSDLDELAKRLPDSPAAWALLALLAAQRGRGSEAQAPMERAAASGEPWILALRASLRAVGSSRVDLQACKLEYSIVSPK